MNIPDGVEQTPAHIFRIWLGSMAGLPGIAGFTRVATDQSLAVFGPLLRIVLQPEHLAECTGNSCALQANFAVVHAVDISDKHVHCAVVSAVGHC